MKKGFTLIELLVSLGLSTLLLFVILSVTLSVLRSQEKQEAIVQVEQQGTMVMSLITQTLRNAEAITSPATGASASSLIVDVVTVADDPTLFDLFGGQIRVTEGVGSAVELTSVDLVASSLTFTNVSIADSPGAMKIEFALSDETYTKTFYGTAALRPQ